MLEPVIVWLVPFNVTVPVCGVKVPPVLIQFPASVILHEAAEQLEAVASSVPAARSRFPVGARLLPRKVEVAVLLTLILLNAVPAEAVMMEELAEAKVVVALGVKVPAVWVKFSLTVSGVEVAHEPLPVKARFWYVLVAASLLYEPVPSYVTVEPPLRLRILLNVSPP